MARLPDFNPQDAAFLADPHGTFHELRRLEPVHWSSPLQSWILTRHADALAVLLDSETFAIGSAHAVGAVGRDIQRSSAGAPLPPTAMLTELDGPAHAKLRQHLASAFTPRALKPVRPSVRATAAGMLERSAGEPFEFVESLAMPLPILAAFALLGIHTEDQELVYARASILMRAMQYADPRMRDQVARAREELDELVRTVLPRRVRRPGLLADLLDAREAGDLTQEELLGLIIFLCTVGQAPTAFALSMAVLALLRHPDELARLRAEPDLLSGVLDEAVRFDSPTRLIRRFATSQTELGGVTIEAGQQIQIMVPAANRDPEVFADPDRFDISRGAQQHLSFGWGSHLCMGPHLTRIIAEEVIGLLLEEFPDLALGERLEMASGLFLGPAVMDLVGRRGMQVSQPARPVPVAKAGRNEACPCGSGKKYKRCHGAAA